MPSLDNIYDVLDLLKKDNIQFCVVALRSGKNKDKADMFYDIKDKDGANTMITAIEELKKIIIKDYKNDGKK